MPSSQLCECRFLGMFLFDHFSVFSELSIEFLFGLPDVEFVAIFARNGINYAVRLIFWNGILLKWK